MGKEKDKGKEEVDIMAMVAIEYNEKDFLAELENSLKEMQEKRNAINSNSTKSSWRDLFTIDEK